MKEKLIAGVLAVFLLLGLSACGRNSDTATSSGSSSSPSIDNEIHSSTLDNTPSSTPSSSEQKYINPAQPISGSRLALADCLWYDKDTSENKVLMTIDLDSLNLSDLQLESGTTLKNASCTIATEGTSARSYAYIAFSIKTGNVDFSTGHTSPISDVNFDSEIVYGKILKNDGDFYLRYETANKYFDNPKPPYMIMVRIYNFTEDGDFGKYYATVYLNGVDNDNDAIITYNTLKNALHFYLYIPDVSTGELDYASFRDINGKTSNIGDYVFFEDILLNLRG